MDIYTVSFFGHREISNFRETEKNLEKLIRELLGTKQYIDFLVGRNGDFDTLVSSAIRRIKNSYRNDNSSHVLVLPYPTAEYLKNKKSFDDYYDEIEICEKSAASHFKAAIQIRNRDMIDRSDLVVCCIEHESGGAFEAYRYAEKAKKARLNIIAGAHSE